MQRSDIGVLLVAGSFAWSAAADPTATLQPIGTAPATVEAISDDGSVVVGAVDLDPTGRSGAFRWSETDGFQALGHLPGGPADAYSYALDVSADGLVVVGGSTDERGRSRAFRWTAAGGMQDIDGGVCDGSLAFGISADGSVIVGTCWDPRGGDSAFRWTEASGFELLDPTRQTHATPLAASGDGSVITGQQVVMSGSSAFRWTEATGFVPLAPTPGMWTTHGSEVSLDGSVIAGQGFAWGDSRPFRWTPSGVEFLSSALVTSAGFRMGMTADGEIVVGEGCVPYVACDWIWDPAGGLRLLQNELVHRYAMDFGGWHIGSPTAISGDGRVIAGTGNDPTDEIRAWRVELSARPVGPVCADGFDNDRDGVADSADAGCATRDDDSESVDCANQSDDDVDGVVDEQDAGCAGAGDGSERDPAAPCDDGEDDDGDAFVDFPTDTGCESVTDPSERGACSDGFDDDGDGGIDLADPGCRDALDPSELSELACDDGVDDDGDGAVDTADRGCPFPDAEPEDPACDDRLDNDGDGLVDFEDPECDAHWPYWEEPACGLGAELVLWAFALERLRRRVAQHGRPVARAPGATRGRPTAKGRVSST